MKWEGVIIKRRGIEQIMLRLRKERKIYGSFVLFFIAVLCLIDLFHLKALIYMICTFVIGFFIGKRDEVIGWEISLKNC
jgi:hypothetical protein